MQSQRFYATSTLRFRALVLQLFSLRPVIAHPFALPCRLGDSLPAQISQTASRKTAFPCGKNYPSEACVCPRKGCLLTSSSSSSLLFSWFRSPSFDPSLPFSLSSLPRDPPLCKKVTQQGQRPETHTFRFYSHISLLEKFCALGAGYGIRTRDLQLGKLPLYHLS